MSRTPDPYNIHSHHVELPQYPGEQHNLDSHLQPPPSRTCPSPTYYRRAEAQSRDRDHPQPASPLSPTYSDYSPREQRHSAISGQDGKILSETSSQRYSNSHFPESHQGTGGGGGTNYDDDDRVEYLPMAEDEKLGYISTGSLIVSNMVGTGVFAKAPYVLANSGGRAVSLLLWLAGGGVTFIGLCLYIELGIAFPFNGAEVVYVDEAFPNPKFLAVTIVTFFVLLQTNVGNCIQFSKLILQSFEPDKNPDPRLEKFFAWFMLTAVCMLHVFSRKLGLAVNNTLAAYKTILMVAIVLVGFAVMAGAGRKNHPSGYGLENFKGAMRTEKKSMSEYANAILGVMWAYYGWDNANYVLAEVKRPVRHESRVFKRASLSSLGLVTTLYVLCNVSYYVVLTDDELSEAGDMVAIRFFRKVFGDGSFIKQGLKVLFALSILGNYIATVYSIARVKQEIAKLKILPFSKFWARQSHYDTPVGAITLHWIVASLLLLCTPNNSVSDDVYNLLTNIYVYSENWILIIVSLAIFSLKYHPKFRDRWTPKFLPWPVLACLVPIFVVINLFIIVLEWLPPPKNLKSSIPSYVTPGVVTALGVFGFLYWLCYSRVLPLLGWHVYYRPDELVDGSRIVSFKVYKTGFAKNLSDWLDDNFHWVFKRKKGRSPRPVPKD